MLLEPMLLRLSAARDLHDILQVGLADIISLHGAEKGNLQLLGADDHLLIVAQRGLSRSFLEVFARVAPAPGTVCGRAARDRKPTFVADVTVDADFAPYREVAASVPFRAVLSCPLITTPGRFIGIVSAHSAHRFVPTPLELGSAATYCTRLADAIVQRVRASDLASVAEALALDLRQATR